MTIGSTCMDCIIVRDRLELSVETSAELYIALHLNDEASMIMKTCGGSRLQQHDHMNI